MLLKYYFFQGALLKSDFFFQDIKQEMHLTLLQIVEKTTHHIKEYVEGADSKMILKELVQILFEQYREIANAHQTFLKYLEKACKAHKVEVNSYDIHFYWSQVQNVVSKGLKLFRLFLKKCDLFCFQLQSFLTDYLDIQSMSSDLQISDINDTKDISIYFSRRKQPM